MTEKFFAMIGLAKRANRIVIGEDRIKSDIKLKKAELVIIANDTSDNTKKSIENSCKYYNVKYIVAGDKETLGKSIGKDFCAAVSINDKNFAKAISEKINQ